MAEISANRIVVPITMSGDGLDDGAAQNIASLKRLRSSLQSTAQASKESGKTIGQLQDEYDQARGQSERLTEKLKGLKEAYEKADPSAEGYAEAQYKAAKAIASCESQLARLDEQMAQNKAAQYGSDADGMRQKLADLSRQTDVETASLRAQGDEAGAAALALKRQGEISQLLAGYQKSLSEALDKAKKECGENSREVEILSGKYNDASDALVKMADKMDNVATVAEDSAKGVKKSISGMMDSITDEQKQAFEQLGSFVKDVVEKFATLTIDTAKAADEILTLSATSGIAAKDLQKMQYAEDLLDVSTGTITDSVTKLTRSMASARDGSAEQADAFKALHVSYKNADGTLKSANTVFYKAIDALGKMQNETERDALAMTLFGKSAKELNPLIEAGSKRLKELGEEAESVGYVMDDQTLGSFGKLADAMARFDKQMDTLKNSLAETMLPLLTALFEAIAKIPVPVLRTLVVLGSVVAGIVYLVKAIKTVTDTGSAIKKFFTETNVETKKTIVIILAVVAALIALAAIIAVIMGRASDLKQSMKSIGSTVSSVKGQVNSTQHNARGSSYYSGGETWVGEEGPERVELPQGSRIYPADESQRRSGGDAFFISVDMDKVSDVNKLINTAQDARRMARMGVPQKA